MVNFRVPWSPVSFCSRTQLTLTSRTLKAEGHSTMPPCWDTLGLFSISRLNEYQWVWCSLDHVLLFLFVCFRQVCLFLKRGANQNAADIDEKTPLTIAVEAANADIVTL